MQRQYSIRASRHHSDSNNFCSTTFELCRRTSLGLRWTLGCCGNFRNTNTFFSWQLLASDSFACGTGSQNIQPPPHTHTHTPINHFPVFGYGYGYGYGYAFWLTQWHLEEAISQLATIETDNPTNWAKLWFIADAHRCSPKGRRDTQFCRYTMVNFFQHNLHDFHNNSNVMQTSHCSNPNCERPIVTNFCTWRGHSAAEDSHSGRKQEWNSFPMELWWENL